jgi:ABC-type sugar transport system ATPase subunit
LNPPIELVNKEQIENKDAGPVVGNNMESLLKLQNISKSFYGIRVLKNVSFDLRKEEILEIADRILVMSDRRVVAELNAHETNKQEIVEYSMHLIS